MKQTPTPTQNQPDPVKSLPSPWGGQREQPAANPIESPVVGQNGSRKIEFTVYHEPMGAPRMTQRDKWKGRPVVERYHAFRDAIRRDAPELPPVDAIDSVSWIAYFETPKSWSRTKREKHLNTRHRVKPDRDNIDKAILDALFIKDEGISDAEFIRKRWALESKLVITIRTT